MTYPPGSSGYPPAQSPGSYGTSATTSFAKSGDSESNLKLYLTIAVAALGFVAYLASFGPMFSVGEESVLGATSSTSGGTYSIYVALLAGLLAAVSLLPKAKNYDAVVAAVAVVGALWLISDTFAGSGRGWGLWLALACVVVQAILAASALLLEAGVITAPAPRPKYDHYGPYGQYGGYYGQQAPYQQSPQQSGYGSQYGGYPSGPSTGGFGAIGPQSGPMHSPQSGPQPAQQQGPPTPPTGFPSFSPPPSSGSGGPGQGNSANHAGSGQPQHAYGQGQQPPSSGPSQS